MKLERLTVFVLISTSFLSGVLAATFAQERKTRKVTRVKRPEFSERDWDGIYFEDLFSEGLVGPRPKSVAPGTAPESSGLSTDSVSGETDVLESFAWSRVLSRNSLENEVKAIQLKLATDISSPLKFKSGYASVHQSFSILSMLFAIVREYDAEVRWKDAAAAAQIEFERAAANSRVGTPQSYQSCKRRRDMLTDLVRGESLVGDEKIPESLDWSKVVGRSPLMERLEESMSRIKQFTSSPGELKSNRDSLIRESELVAAIAQVLTRDNMADADDEGYSQLATDMYRAAMDVVAGCKQENYDQASQAANLMGQSCSNCHDEWR